MALIELERSALRRFCRQHNISWAQSYHPIISDIAAMTGITGRIEDHFDLDQDGMPMKSFKMLFAFETDAEMVEFKLKWL